MSRTEWLTIVVLMASILAVNIFTLTYQVFIWRDVCDMWRIILENDFYRKRASYYGRQYMTTPTKKEPPNG